jgi:TolB-like protein
LAAYRHWSSALPVLAIVPFDVDRNSPELVRYRDELAESLTEGSTRMLSRGVAVLGPAMTQGFGSRTPIDSIAMRTRPAYAVSGVVRRRGDRVDVFAQFIRSTDRAHLWAFRMIDSTSVDGAAAGRRIADSVAAILLHPERPRQPRGFEGK